MRDLGRFFRAPASVSAHLGRSWPALIGLLGALWAHSAAAQPALRLESSAGIDSNVTRAEQSGQGHSAAMARLVVDLEHSGRHGAFAHNITWQGGAQHFFGYDGEDVISQRLSSQLQGWIGRTAALGLRASLQDRSTHDPLQPRDYTRVAVGPSLDLRFGALQISAQWEAERLIFKPDARFDADAMGGWLAFDLGLPAQLALNLRGGYYRREFSGVRMVDSQVIGAIEDPFGHRRRDDLWSASLGLRGLGEWLWSVEYRWIDNQSNALNGAFRRHDLSAQLSKNLPLGFVLSLRSSMQFLSYTDAFALSPLELISDESRSSVSGRVEYGLDDQWALVLSGGVWFSAFGSDTDFTRLLGLFGVAYYIDD